MLFDLFARLAIRSGTLARLDSRVSPEAIRGCMVDHLQATRSARPVASRIVAFLATRRERTTSRRLISIRPDASAKHKSLPLAPPASE